MFDNLSIVVSWVQPGLGVFKDEGRRSNLFYKFIFKRYFWTPVTLTLMR